MEEIRTRARLVDPAASSLSTRGLTTLVPRAEVEEAFHRGEFPAPLVLDIARTDGSDDVTAHAQVTVDWDQAMLEELLRSTDDDQIRLSFDADELEQTLQEAEVDAHGLRERAAVLVVGVAAVGATAGGAFASGPSITPDYAGAPGATVHSTVATDAGSGTESNPLARYVASIDSQATAQTPAFVSDVAAGGTGSPAGAVAPISDVASGGTGSPAGTVAPISDVASGDLGSPAGVVAPISDVASGGSGQAAPDALARYVGNVGSDVAATPTPSFVSDVAAGGTGDATTDSLSRYVGNVGSEPTVAAPAGDSGSSISLPSPAEGAGIAAGLALLIMGAGFTAARSRRPPEQPA